MLSTSNTSSRPEQLNSRKLWWVTPLAGLGVAVANTIIFFIGDVSGALPKDFVFSTSNQPLSAGLVASFSFIGVMVGGAILAGLGRFTRRPLTIFRVIAVGFLMLFAFAPLTIGAPFSMILLLELMHLVAGALAIVMLTTLTKS